MSDAAHSSSIAGLVAQWKGISAESRTPRGSGEPGRESKRSSGGSNAVAAPRLCLVEMLRVAAQLEFATIPPYLCALWSIENELDPVAQSIREVVQEEMLHLALVCNLLAALGERPQLRKWAPSYPTALPGKVHPGLVVSLQGLNRDSLAGFIRIESPEMLPENVDIEHGDPYWGGGETIGALYESILAAFRHLKPDFRTDTQVTGPLSWRTIASLDDVEWAIRLIEHQGEGAVLSPLDSGESDLAHYYRFLEIWKGKRLEFSESDGRFYWRGKVCFPECKPMGPVPIGGYSGALERSVKRHLTEFDEAYSKMLGELECAWLPRSDSEWGGQGALMRAYGYMFELGKHARPLMNMKIDSSGGFTYGPQFRCHVGS